MEPKARQGKLLPKGFVAESVAPRAAAANRTDNSWVPHLRLQLSPLLFQDQHLPPRLPAHRTLVLLALQFKEPARKYNCYPSLVLTGVLFHLKMVILVF